MRWLNDVEVEQRRGEDGAVAVIVALLLVVLLGVVALAVDGGAMHAEKRELQNGADAGALAIAQDCAGGGCGTYIDKANAFAAYNHLLGEAAAEVPELVDNGTNGRVTVRTYSEPALRHRFAPVFDKDDPDNRSAVITASATAAWGAVGSAHVLPLTIAKCEWKYYTSDGNENEYVDPEELPSSGEAALRFHSGNAPTTCDHSSSGADLPGGFGWLKIGDGSKKVDADGECTTQVSAEQLVDENPGNDTPCESSSHFAPLLGSEVLIPIFDYNTGSGNKGQYHIIGFGAFILTSYDFGNKFDTAEYAGYDSCTTLLAAAEVENGEAEDKGDGDVRCISGFFTRFIDVGAVYDGNLQPLGGTAVSLIE